MARGRKAAAHAGPVEELWALPAGWAWREAREFADVVGGGTPRNAGDPKNFDPNGTPWITPADLSGYKLPSIARGARSLSQFGLSNGGGTPLPVGTVLISSRAPVGYCAVAEVPCTTNQGFKSLVLQDGSNPFFVRYYILRSRQYLQDNASGTTFKELSGGAMEALAFPIPPRQVQDAIVSRIDAMFAEIEEGEAALAEARVGVETYRKALLKAAVTGELTADWRRQNPPRESGADLLQRIIAERRARWEADTRNIRKYAEPGGPDSDGLPELPQGWVWSSVGQLFRVGVGTTPSRANRSLWTGDLPWVSSGEVAFTRISATAETIDRTVVKAHRLCQPGTVLLGMIGEGKTRGQAAVLDIEAHHNQNCASIHVYETPIPPHFVAWWLEHRYEKTRTEGSGGNQPALNKERVEAIPFPVPPEIELKEISSRLQALLAIGAETEVEVAQLGAAPAGLRQSILTAAFRGELFA